MATTPFSASVSAAVQKRKDLIPEVFRRSVQEVASIAQTPGPSVHNPSGGRGGHMPIGPTGFLRASFSAAIGDMIPTAIENPGRETRHGYEAGPVNLVIAGAGIRDTITLAWRANYAGIVHRRYQWASLAGQRWPQAVRDVSAEVAKEAGL